MGAVDLLSLKGRAQKLRDTLNKSKSTTESMIGMLTAFDSKLRELESSMRPIQVKTNAYLRVHRNIDVAVQAVEKVLKKYNIPRQVGIDMRDIASRDVDAMSAMVVLLDEAISFFESHKQFRDSAGTLSHATEMKRKILEKWHADLEKELGTLPKHVDQLLLSSISEELEEYPKESIESREHFFEDLRSSLPEASVTFMHRLCTNLISFGQSSSCTKIYRTSRSQYVLNTLSKLGVERVSQEEIERIEWNVLEGRIGIWIAHLRVIVGAVFVAEYRLCQTVFAGMESHGEMAFAELVDAPLTTLISFGIAVAKCASAPERLFVLLDIYEAIRDLMPTTDRIFNTQACIPAKHSLETLKGQLATAISSTLVSFEKAVEKDGNKTAGMDGTVHPLASYVVNYIKFLVDYEPTLIDVFSSSGVSDETTLPAVRVSQSLDAVFTALWSNLEIKSRTYKDPPLVHIFLMNNAAYLVKSMAKSEVASKILGPEWLEKYRKMVQQYSIAYQKASWGKISSIFLNLGVSGEGSLPKNVIKDRLKQFNFLFEEIYEKQTSWNIPDSSLREILLTSVSAPVLASYAAFLTRAMPNSESQGRGQTKHIKYTVAEIEILIQDLFTGKLLPAL